MAAATYKVSRDDLFSELDIQAKNLLNISGDEFVSRYKAGTLDLSSAVVARLAVLARLVTR